MAKRELTDGEDLVLSILYDHGPMTFRTAADLTACETLTRDGYISDHGPGACKRLSAKGHRYLETH